jgi:hypothetical protein
MAGAARRPIASSQGKRNARRKVLVQIANLPRFEQLCKVPPKHVAKTVTDSLPKICRNDKKKRCSGEHLLMHCVGWCAYWRICALAMFTPIAVPEKFW